MTLEVLNISKNKSSEPVFVFRYQFGAENHVILHPSIKKLRKFWDNYLCVIICILLFKLVNLGKESAEKDKFLSKPNNTNICLNSKSFNNFC